MSDQSQLRGCFSLNGLWFESLPERQTQQRFLTVWFYQMFGFTKCPPFGGGECEGLSYPDPLLWMLCIASVFALHLWQEPSNHCNFVWKKIQAAKQRCAKTKGAQTGPHNASEQKRRIQKLLNLMIAILLGLCLKPSSICKHFAGVFADFTTEIHQYDWDSVRQEQGDINRRYSGSHLDLSKRNRIHTALEEIRWLQITEIIHFSGS